MQQGLQAVVQTRRVAGTVQGNGDDAGFVLSGGLGQKRQFAQAGRTVVAPEIDDGDARRQIAQADETLCIGQFKIECGRERGLWAFGAVDRESRPAQAEQAGQKYVMAKAPDHSAYFTPA